MINFIGIFSTDKIINTTFKDICNLNKSSQRGISPPTFNIADMAGIDVQLVCNIFLRDAL